MQDKYTKYIIQMKIASNKDDLWYDYNDDFISLGEAENAIEFFRDTHMSRKTHLFRITKRDYETIDTVINEKTS
jgi:hypothetical protein